MSSNDEVRVLELTLHNDVVGYLAGFRNNRNVFTFADSFKTHPNRPTFSLITRPSFPKVDDILNKPWTTHQRLHPILSNLLPEGALRELLVQGLKTHIDHEFEILAHLGQDLPGALIASPMEPDKVPASILSIYTNAKPVPIVKNS